MKKSLSARLTYRIMAVVLAMMMVIAGVVYVTVREYMRDEAKERYRGILLENQQELRRWLTEITVATQNNVHDIERDIDHPDLMFDHMHRLVANNRFIVCSAILFKPDYYPAKGRVFIPCARKDSTGHIHVRRIDSTYQSTFYGQWFQQQLEKDQSGWTAPYMESQHFAGDQQPRRLTTCIAPIHDRDGRPVGILGADVSLDVLRSRLMEDIKEMNDQYEVGHHNQSYFFVIDRQGTFIIHPDSQRVMTHIDKNMGKMMLKHRGTCVTEVDGITSRLYYRTLKDVNWIMVIVTPEDVILSNARQLNYVILLTMILGLVAIYLICRHQIKGIADPVAAQKAAMERELLIAHDIQMSMLPDAQQPLATEHLTLHAMLTPARDVGGDLYDYFIRDGQLFFCIGDVSGKGVPAALVMTTVCRIFRLLAEHESDPAHIVSRMNDMMARDNELSVFVTFFVGVLNLSTGQLNYSNAGHKAPFMPDGTTLPVHRNLAVGVMSGWQYTTQQTTLAPGTTLFLYTDGLDEAEDSRHQMFGKPRIKEVLVQSPQSTDAIIENMTNAVARFVDGNEQSDDLTMLAIRYQ